MKETIASILFSLSISLSLFTAPTNGGDSSTKRFGGEKKEAFDYYSEGQTRRGVRRLLTLDLGDGVRMELVGIHAGKFQMGSEPGGKDRLADEDQHHVEISHDFYLGKYEV